MDFLDSVRLEIGDTVVNDGILPGSRQFKENEIFHLAGTEGVTDFTSSHTQMDVGRTAARCLEVAAVQWASQPDEIELGPNIQKGKRQQQLQRAADSLRTKWGYGSPVGSQDDKTPSYSSSGFTPYIQGA